MKKKLGTCSVCGSQVKDKSRKNTPISTDKLRSQTIKRLKENNKTLSEGETFEDDFSFAKVEYKINFQEADAPTLTIIKVTPSKDKSFFGGNINEVQAGAGSMYDNFEDFRIRLEEHMCEVEEAEIEFNFDAMEEGIYQ